MEVLARVGSSDEKRMRRIASQWRTPGWRLSVAVLALSVPFWLGIGVLQGALTWWVAGGPVMTAAVLSTVGAIAALATRNADKAVAAANAATWWVVLFVVSIIGRGLTK